MGAPSSAGPAPRMGVSDVFRLLKPPHPEPPPVAELLFGPVAGTTALVVVAVTLLLLASHLRDSLRRENAQSVASLRQENAERIATSPAAPAAVPIPKTPYKICIVGSGNWGSAIARVVGLNAAVHPILDETVNMWVYEEQIKGEKLTEIINTTHVNVKYLPNTRLPPNVVAVPELSKAAEGATLLVFVLPHQFLSRLCPQIMPVVAPGCRAISLIKGVEFEAGAPRLISSIISLHLGGMDVAVLMGANFANEVRARSRPGDETRLPKKSPMPTPHATARELPAVFSRARPVPAALEHLPRCACRERSSMWCEGMCGSQLLTAGIPAFVAPPPFPSLPYPQRMLYRLRQSGPPPPPAQVAQDEFCEATIGCADAAAGQTWQVCFHRPSFNVSIVRDVAGVELCGALKNVVALGAGFCDGVGFGANTKAAIVRLGLREMQQFSALFFAGVDAETFFESCGMADLITTCYGGRNRKCAEAFARLGRGAQWEAVEAELLNGQKLQGTLTCQDVHACLVAKGPDAQARFPLLEAIYAISFEERDPATIVQLTGDR